MEAFSRDSFNIKSIIIGTIDPESGSGEREWEKSQSEFVEHCVSLGKSMWTKKPTWLFDKSMFWNNDACSRIP